MYDCYFTNVLTQRSCVEVLPTADSQCFPRGDAHTFVPTIPTKTNVTVSWNIEVFAHSNSASSVVIFFQQAPRHQFLLPANLHRHSRRPRFQPDETSSLLDCRRQKAIKRTAVSACVAFGNIHNAVCRHLDKNRVKHGRTIFSKNKAQESKRRSMN